MLTLTCCQDHILTETSYSGDERRCHGCGTNNRTLKIELLSQWKLEAEFRKNSNKLQINIKEKVYSTKNHKKTATNYQINKEKINSHVDRQSQQKIIKYSDKLQNLKKKCETTFLEQILKWTETVATKIKNSIVHRTILSLLWLETFHMEGIILYRLEGITHKRGYISVKKV